VINRFLALPKGKLDDKKSLLISTQVGSTTASLCVIYLSIIARCPEPPGQVGEHDDVLPRRGQTSTTKIVKPCRLLSGVSTMRRLAQDSWPVAGMLSR
jgi:hypothetical protein